MTRTAFVSAAQRRKTAFTFISAVAARDLANAAATAQLPGFNPDALADVPAVGWSEPDHPASAMLVAVDNLDRRMVSLVHGLGGSAGIDRGGDDPLLVLAEKHEPTSSKVLAQVLALSAGSMDGSARPSEALQRVLLHTPSPKLAGQKINLLLAAGARRRYANKDGVTTPDLVTLRIQHQPSFAYYAANLLATGQPKPIDKLPSYVRGAMGMLKR